MYWTLLQSNYAIGLPNRVSTRIGASADDLLVIISSRNLLVIMGNTDNSVENINVSCL
jgi:hypothetical protein